MNKAYSRTETNQAAYEPTSLHSDNPHTPTERIRVEKSPPTEMPVCGSASRSAGGAVRPFCIPNSASTATTRLELGSFCRQNLRKKSIGVALDRWPTDRRQCLLTILLALTVGRHNVPAPRIQTQPPLVSGRGGQPPRWPMTMARECVVADRLTRTNNGRREVDLFLTNLVFCSGHR